MKTEGTKRERFVRTAPPRVQRILDTLDRLWYCSNTINYEYTEADVKTMFNTIREKQDFVEEAFVPVRRRSRKNSN